MIDDDKCTYYKAEKDNPYPLCVGNDNADCENCCYYCDYEVGKAIYKEDLE